MNTFDPQLPASGQNRPAGLTRRAALGIAGVLGLSRHGLSDVAMSKKKRRKKRSRSVPL